MNKTNSIRVNTGAKKIEVNDDGDFILLNFADQSLPTRYFALLEDMEARQTEYQARAKTIDEDPGLDDMTRFKAAAQLNLDIHAYMREQVDSLFGADTCRKVFGDIVPSMDLYADFFEQLSPYFERYAAQRKAQLKQKYSPARTGNV